MLIVNFRFSPIFTNVQLGGQDDTLLQPVYQCSRWEAMLGAAGIQVASKSKKTALSEMPKSAPIVVFPEGTTTNGRGILRPVADFSLVPANQRIHVFGFRYL